MNEIRGGYTHFGLKLEFGFFKIHPRNEWGGGIKLRPKLYGKQESFKSQGFLLTENFVQR